MKRKMNAYLSVRLIGKWFQRAAHLSEGPAPPPQKNALSPQKMALNVKTC